MNGFFETMNIDLIEGRRVGRLNFLIYSILGVLAFIPFAVFIFMTGAPSVDEQHMSNIQIFFFVSWNIAYFVFSLRLLQCRARDLNLGFAIMILLLIIPFINLVLNLMMVFKKGTPGTNNFGTDPLEVLEENTPLSSP
ncbi:MAG: DUF805 domain-containing protein [Oligoflexales bacterium]